ncbi:MAG: zinc metalloprotease, partial [Bacteroidia bacterium]|nr:zinc metalloprotease [Bacteroidia bacterium]
MKKLFFAFAALALLFTSCSDDQKQFVQEENINMDDWYVYTDADLDETSRMAENKGKSCYSMVNLNRLLNENPGLERKMYDIEYQTRSIIAGKKPDNPGGGNGGGNNGGGDDGGGDPPVDNLGVINIPVYVHVIYSNSQQNISNAQIDSQIQVLNDDFRRTNSDASNTPSVFSGVVADSEITFSLAGITRKASSVTSWGTNDAMKFASNGGVDVITPETHLNIWVCNIGGGILG